MHTLRVLTTLLVIGLLSAPLAIQADPGSLTPDLIEKYRKQTDDNALIRPIVNAATNNDIKSLSLNRDIIAGHDSQFNFELEGSKIIDQKISGRCWMFAGANVATPEIMARLKLKDFKLSEAYLAFWDKLEKSNLFLETMIRMRDRDIEDRALQMYLESPVGDGGWWQYFQGLIGKYGLVTAAAMPETEQSTKTARSNGLLNMLLRKATAEIRRLAAEGKKEKAIREYKESVLGEVYSLLVCTYGRPPQTFTLRYEEEVDDSTKHLVEQQFTPLEFYNTYYAPALPRFVAISDNPNRPYGKLYKMESSRNMFEEPDIEVVNLPIEKLKKYAYESILDSQIVWFACDVTHDEYRDSGILAVDVYDYGTTFGIDFKYSKADRLAYKDLTTNHAMALVGLDTTASGQPRRWKVENSWGADKGNGGYWSMYDDWFDQYVLLVMVDETRLEPDDAAILRQKPVIIKDWEPFYRDLRTIQ